jgi:hypothetical protein
MEIEREVVQMAEKVKEFCETRTIHECFKECPFRYDGECLLRGEDPSEWQID